MRGALRRLIAAPIAHRGLHACGRQGPVENSIGAAEAAIAGGFGIECDIQLSRDGEAMVFHDERLERLTGATGRLADHESSALSSLALGGGPDRIPTLAAFVAAIRGRAALFVEIKSGCADDMLLTERAVALVKGYDGPVALESFDPTIIAHCHRLGAPCPIGLVGPSEAGTEPAPALVARCDFLSWKIDYVAAIAERHPQLPRTTWTVRTKEQQALAARCEAQIVFEAFAPLTFR